MAKNWLRDHPKLVAAGWYSFGGDGCRPMVKAYSVGWFPRQKEFKLFLGLNTVFGSKLDTPTEREPNKNKLDAKSY